MLKKTITYKDYNNQEVTEDFYFNLNQDEVIEMQMSHEDGLGEHLKAIVASGEGAKVYQEFKKIILMAYGVKSPDGRRFVKNEQVTQDFLATRACSDLIVQLITNPDQMAEFVQGIVPEGLEDVADRISKAAAGQQELSLLKQEPQLTLEQWIAARGDWLHQNAGTPLPEHLKSRKLSQPEVAAMDNQELKSGLADGRYYL